MKTVNLKSLLGLLVLFPMLTGLQCKKDIPGPSEAGFTPLDKKVYCKIDGQEWQSCDRFMSPRQSHWTNYGGGSFTLSFSDWCSDGPHRSFFFRFKSKITGLGTYSFDSENYGTYYVSNGIKYEIRAYTNDTLGGKLTIAKFDVTRHKVSGSFFFNAYDTVSRRVIRITEGQFNNVADY